MDVKPQKVLRTISFIFTMVLFVSVLIIVSPALTRGGTNVAPREDSLKQLTLIFMGDVMQHMPQVEAAYNRMTDTYKYDSCFRYIKNILYRADIAVANFETTLAGKPYSGYPTFSAPDELAIDLQHAGVGYVCTANNHCCDHGRKGIERTIRVMDSIGLRHLGTYVDSNAYKKYNPLIIRKNGFKVAFLNYTYSTNGMPIPKGNIVSLIDRQQIEKDIKMSHDSLADMVIILIHWGEEYQREPDTMQKGLADFCFSKGADIIIGSHPHVIQPIEWDKADSIHKDRFVAWSLGNAVSNQRKQFTDGGAMVQLTLVKTTGETHISGAGYMLNWVQVPGYTMIPAGLAEKNTKIIKPSEKSQFDLFLHDSRSLLNQGNKNVKEIRNY